MILMVIVCCGGGVVWKLIGMIGCVGVLKGCCERLECNKVCK